MRTHLASIVAVVVSACGSQSSSEVPASDASETDSSDTATPHVDGATTDGSATDGPHGDVDDADAATPSPFVDTEDGIHAFLTFDYHIDPKTQIPTLAPRTDFVWGSGYPTEWHAANPRTFVSFYMTWDQDDDNQSLDWWNAHHPDWVVYECDRTTPARISGYPNLILDVTNAEVQAWQLDRVKAAAAKGYDGIAFDVFSLLDQRGACGVFRKGAWVQLYDGTSGDPKYTADAIAWLKSMYAAMHALPKPMGLVPNYTLDRAPDDPVIAQLVANVDGVLDEESTGNYGYFTTDDRWVQRMQFVETLQSAGKSYFALSGFTTVDASSIQWALASYLVTKEHHEAIYVAQASGGTYGSDAWRTEYEAAIGAPCGAMTSTSGVTVRAFAKSLAIVNPSSSKSATYVLPAGAYRDLYGKSVSGSVTLGPHSGVVLLVVGAPAC